jgi:hypothetical protein
MLPAKITKTIMLLGKLRVRFHLKLDNNMHNEWDYNHQVYTSLSPVSYATIENTDNPGVETSVMVTPGNIFSVITAANRIIKNIYEQPIYATRNGKLIIYDDEANKHRVLTQLYGSGALMFKPTIIYDQNETAYEGAALSINNTDNTVNLSIDQLEAFRYCITKIDFAVYSQLLMNYVVSYYGYNKDTNKSQQPGRKPSIDWSTPTQQEHIQTTFTRKKNNEMEELMGLCNKE